MPQTVTMPSLPDSGDILKIMRIHARPGDRVRQGAPLLDAETQKAGATVYFDHSGVVRRVLVKEGMFVQAGAPLAELDVQG